MPEPLENSPPTAALNTETTTPDSQPASTEGLRFSTQGKGEPFEVAVLALQNLTIFPETVIPLGIGRPRSIAAVEAALATPEKLLCCITVHPDRSDDTDAKSSDLYEVGTLVMIKRMERIDQGMRIIAQGTERIRVVQWKQEDPHLRAVVEILPEPRTVDADQVEAAKRNLQQMITEALALLPNVPPEVRIAVLGQADATRLSYFLASILNLGVEEEQKMLEANTVDELVRLAHTSLVREVEILQLRSKIASEAQGEMDKAQRDYVLRQQMRAIQKELGEDETGEAAETEMLRERLEKAELPEEVRAEADRELKRLQRLPPAAPDYHVIRTYLEFILELPWLKSSEDKLDLAEARRILDEDHYGLEDSRVPGRDQTAAGHEESDTAFCRTAGRRQNVAGTIDCACARTAV
jgi:ATP-dependent Lon protease